VVSGLTQSISITIFTEASMNISRPSIPIAFGDGNTGTFTLSPAAAAGTVNVKTYSGTHTYAGSGTYMAFFQDTFRIAGIKNMTNSQSQSIRTEAMIVMSNVTQQNTSPLLLNPPFNSGITGSQFNYTPAYSDVDGDSLSYALTSCIGAGYYQPALSSISSSGVFSFYTDSAGIYVFSILAKEWRKNTSGVYQVIGITQMDFPVEVSLATVIKETANENHTMFLFPNPVTDELNISCDEKNFEEFSIEAINCLGQIVLKTCNDKKINVSSLPKGLYILKLADKNKSTRVGRFLKD